MNYNHDMTRKTLGRFAQIGSLYDIACDQLVSGSIFSEILSADSIDITCEDTPHIDYTFDNENTYTSTLKKLNIEGELKVNILTGIVDADASNKVLRTVNKNHNVARSTMIYRIETYLQTLQLSHKDLQSRIAENSFQGSSATHVITKIKWGAYVVASFSAYVDKDCKQHEIQGKMKIAVEKLRNLLSGSAGVEAGHTSDVQSDLDGVSIEMSGDIILPKLPTTIDEVRTFIADVPKLIKDINGGKGNQIEFTLTPIGEVARQLSISNDSYIFPKCIRQLSDSIVSSIEHESDEFLHEMQDVNQFMDIANNYRQHLRHEVYMEVMNQRNLLKKNYAQFRDDMASLLRAYRSHASDDNQTKNKLMERLENKREESIKDFRMFSQKSQSLQKKIDIVQQLQENDVQCIGQDEPLSSFLYSPKDVFVLLLRGLWSNDNKAKFLETFHQFRHLKHKKQNQADYCMIDLDLNESNDMITSATDICGIVHYKDGIFVGIEEDCILYHNLQIEHEIAQYEQDSKAQLDRKELTDQDMEMVTKELIINKRCTELSLNSNNITQRGASILADGLRKSNTLIALKLNGNQVSDKGVFAVAQTLEVANKTLEILDLGSNDITDQGAIYLAEMLRKNTTLTNLDLSMNRIGERGVRHLVGALDGDNKGLKRLSLRNNKSITDSSVDWLATMIKCNRFLDALDVGNCSLSASSKEQLQKTVQSKRAFSLVM